MVEVTTRSRVDAFWSSTMDVPMAELHQAGIRVYPNPPQREQWRGIYVLAFDQAVSVFAPVDHLDKVSTAVAEHDAATLLDAGAWRTTLGESVRAAYGPVAHFYLDRADGLKALAGGRRINPNDAAALTDLNRAVPSQEWTAAGFSGHPAVLFGLFDGDRLLAAANLTSGPDTATDVGVLTHPDARGRGLGLKVAAAAALQAISLHGIARFRALTTSAATLAIAGRLGFQPYGHNLSAYLSG
jgi:GNAT superfamily N-acetyltransferase